MASAAGMEGMLVMLHTQNAASGGEGNTAASEVTDFVLIERIRRNHVTTGYVHRTSIARFSCVGQSWLCSRRFAAQG